MNLICHSRDWPTFVAGLAEKYAMPAEVADKSPRPREYPCLVSTTIANGILVTNFVYLTDCWVLLQEFARGLTAAKVQPDEVPREMVLDPHMVTAHIWTIIGLLTKSRLTHTGEYEEAYNGKRLLLDETLTATREKSPLPTEAHEEAYRYLRQLGLVPDGKPNANSQ